MGLTKMPAFAFIGSSKMGEHRPLPLKNMNERAFFHVMLEERKGRSSGEVAYN